MKGIVDIREINTNSLNNSTVMKGIDDIRENNT
jgi:hypothetical protein